MADNKRFKYGDKVRVGNYKGTVELTYNDGTILVRTQQGKGVLCTSDNGVLKTSSPIPFDYIMGAGTKPMKDSEVEQIDISERIEQTPTPHQFKVGDKVRILSDAWLESSKTTTTVVSEGFQSAVGCIVAVASVCTKYITVTTPSGCGGDWSYQPEQLALVVENAPEIEQAVTTTVAPSTPPCDEVLDVEDVVIQGNQSKMLSDSSHNSPNTAQGTSLFLTLAQRELVKQALQKRLAELELECAPLIELLAQLDTQDGTA